MLLIGDLSRQSGQSAIVLSQSPTYQQHRFTRPQVLWYLCWEEKFFLIIRFIFGYQPVSKPISSLTHTYKRYIQYLINALVTNRFYILKLWINMKAFQVLHRLNEKCVTFHVIKRFRLISDWYTTQVCHYYK